MKLILTVFLLLPFGAFSQGFSVGNFGIAAESDKGRIFSRIKYNPSKLGVWLEDLGSSSITLNINGKSITDETLKWTTIARDFPELHLVSSDPKLDGLEIELRSFAPIGIGEQRSANGFLPVISVEVTLRNLAGRAVSLDVEFSLDPVTKSHVQRRVDRTSSRNMTFVASKPGFIAVDGPARTGSPSNKMQLQVPTKLSNGASKKINFYLGVFEPTGAYTAEYHDLPSLVAGVSKNHAALSQDYEEFIEHLPKTGDAEIDRALRWYVSAAVLMTRGTRNEVLTMGYRELNQRDSFWTSWIHLFFWPNLERRMILESMAAQLPTGQIPTTILPLIETDAIDITEYFVLRVLRFYQWYREEPFLINAWPHVEKAIEYLRYRDKEGVGLPRQETFWADWKDVQGVEGRRYAPHFSLLWLAVLREAESAASHLGKDEQARKLRADYDRAYTTINRDLWNGRYYVARWDARETSDVVLLDQVVGIFFNVISRERVESIFRSLKANETRWGIRETYPYMPEPFEQPEKGGGIYHNGGIWPWLCFVDATGRYAYGHVADAERSLKNIARADLFMDWTPSEFLNGNDGSNQGYPIQGWNGAIFGTIYLGAFGLNRSSRQQMHLRPTFHGRDFNTWLVLPGGKVRLRRVGGVLLPPEIPQPLPYELIIEEQNVPSTTEPSG